MPSDVEMAVVQLEDDVQLVVDTFRSGPASRKAAHLQDLYALLCSPIRNGNARGEVFWEALGRLWARTNRHICMSQYLAMCLRLRAEKPDDEDPVWFVADATNWHSDAMLEGFDAELLLRVLEGEKGGHTYVRRWALAACSSRRDCCHVGRCWSGCGAAGPRQWRAKRARSCW